MQFPYPPKGFIQPFAPSLLSGFLLGLAYPSFPFVRLEFFAWFALVPLLRELARVTSFQAYLVRVSVALTVAFLLMTSWLLIASASGYLAAALVGSVVLIVPPILLYPVQKAWGWRLAVWSLPVLWTAWEWLYHQTELSFGAVRIGNTQAQNWWLVQYVDLTGVYGVTFWIILLNVGLAWALEKWQAQERCSWVALRPFAVFVVVMFGLPLLYTAWVFAHDVEPARTAAVLLVQPNLDPQRTRFRQAMPTWN